MPYRPVPTRSLSEEEIRLTTPSSPKNGSIELLPADQYPKDHFEKVPGNRDHDREEEFAALLADSKDLQTNERHAKRSRWLPRWSSFTEDNALLYLTGIFGMVLLAAIIFGSLLWYWVMPHFHRAKHSTSQSYDASIILSNGTHDYRRTVLMVSLDGLRAEYVDRNLTTHLHDISVQGLRAKYMVPVFPSLTFPNHWALMTGLYAESHGIVANTFWDPATEQSFKYTQPAHSWNASWWSGEPLWETAEKGGLLTANLMWPGPPVTSDGHKPTYYVPFKDHVSLEAKHDQIFEWIDLPLEKRPQLITAYEPSVDQVGHKYGPSAPEVDDALKKVDLFARRIHRSLAARNLTHIVDVIFVSDHGMVDTSDLRLVYVDDILGKDAWDAIEHNDGWPSYGLRFADYVNTTDVLFRLYSSAANYQPPAYDVYVTHDFYAQLKSQNLLNIGGHAVVPMPKRYHYTNNIRIAPIYVVPRLGWALTNRHEHLVIMDGKYQPRGNHGYDPFVPEMHAIFVADGPFSSATKAKQSNKIPSVESSGPLVMKGFKNVEVYNLVTKLLGLDAASTNGTAGFWDEWLD